MSKKIIISVIAVIILALIGGGVWYLNKYQISSNKGQVTKNNGQENTPEIGNQNQPSTIENQKSEIINTNDWLTYHNEEYGFEVKYPNTWLLNNTQSGIYIKYQKDWEFGMKEGFSAFGVSIIKENLQEFIKSYDADFLDGEPLTKIIKEEKYDLEGIPATKLTSNNAEGINGNFIFVKYNKNNYLITFNENEKRHKEILSTFKFIK
jgi:uncharacterized protein YxeA